MPGNMHRPKKKKDHHLKTSIRRGLQPPVIDHPPFEKLLRLRERVEIKMQLFENLIKES